MANRRELLDTRQAFDAGLCGYDGPRDPREDGEGLIIEGRMASLKDTPVVKLIGPDGEVELVARGEILAAATSILSTIGIDLRALLGSGAQAGLEAA